MAALNLCIIQAASRFPVDFGDFPNVSTGVRKKVRSGAASELRG
jgi:hypothetical protein